MSGTAKARCCQSVLSANDTPSAMSNILSPSPLRLANLPCFVVIAFVAGWSVVGSLSYLDLGLRVTLKISLEGRDGGEVERVEGLGEVSSTEARETREIERLKVLVGEEVAKFIVEKGMYGWGEDGGKEG